MLDHNYLNIRLLRVKPLEQWRIDGRGLFFVFPKVGAGQSVVGSVNQRIGPGDVLIVDGAAGGRLVAADAVDFVFWCFAACMVHLFPLFDGEEISLLREVTDDFCAGSRCSVGRVED